VSGSATTARLLTAPARGGIAVILLAGPDVRAILAKVFRPRKAAPSPSRLSLGWLVREEEVLDEAVVALGRGGDQDWAEINIHGGPHVARRVLTALVECGAEMVVDAEVDPTLAVPAEGLDNPAVTEEMLSALGRAATPLVVSAVTAQWRGGLSALAASARPDPAGLRASADALCLMKRLLRPAEVVIAGPPNVGKSALANAVVGREVSIVSDTPGTTRDWVRAPADAEGVPIWLTDTAGLWGAAEGADAEAVRRAWAQIASADLILLLTAGQAGDEHTGPLLDRLRRRGRVLNVAAKCDVAGPDARAEVCVSAKTFAGLDDLRRAIRRRLGFADFDPAAPMAFTKRQARLLSAAAEAIERGDREGGRSILRELLAGPVNAPPGEK